MAYTHKVLTTFNNGTTLFSVQDSVTVAAQVTIEETIANGGTNVEVTVAVDATNMKSFALVSDQDVTVKTNSSSTPDDTFTLKANKPIVWTENMPNNPLSADITSIFVTNSSGASATVRLVSGYDPTP